MFRLQSTLISKTHPSDYDSDDTASTRTPSSSLSLKNIRSPKKSGNHLSPNLSPTRQSYDARQTCQNQITGRSKLTGHGHIGAACVRITEARDSIPQTKTLPPRNKSTSPLRLPSMATRRGRMTERGSVPEIPITNRRLSIDSKMTMSRSTPQSPSPTKRETAFPFRNRCGTVVRKRGYSFRRHSAPKSPAAIFSLRFLMHDQCQHPISWFQEISALSMVVGSWVCTHAIYSVLA